MPNLEQCDHCQREPGRIKHQGQLKCWSCYQAESIIKNKQDWRDKMQQEHTKKNDLVLREGETLKNLANRAKKKLMDFDFSRLNKNRAS